MDQRNCKTEVQIAGNERANWPRHRCPEKNSNAIVGNIAGIRSKLNVSTWFAAGTMKTSWKILREFLHWEIATIVMRLTAAGSSNG
jgi:hypothetical protein